MKNYGELLKIHRLSKDLTLKEVEEKTGTNNGSISRWENSKAIPGINYCEMLADAYEISLDELVGRNIERAN